MKGVTRKSRVKSQLEGTKYAFFSGEPRRLVKIISHIKCFFHGLMVDTALYMFTFGFVR